MNNVTKVKSVNRFYYYNTEGIQHKVSSAERKFAMLRLGQKRENKC